MLVDGQFFGQIDRCHLKQAALIVAFFQVVHDDIQHGRREQGAHDGEVLADGVEDADSLTGSIILRNVEHIQLRVGVECQGGRLIEALGSQQALGLELLLLLVVQAAVGNRSGVQECGHNVVVAILTDDLFRQIGEAVHVLTVQRCRDVPAAIRLHIHRKLQTPENIDHGLVRDGDAQHAADLGRSGDDVLPLNGTAIGQVKFQRGDIAAVQLLDQVQSTGKAQLRRMAVHALFVAGGRIAVLAQSAAGLTDRIARKGSALEQQVGGILIHPGVCTAHDAS